MAGHSEAYKSKPVSIYLYNLYIMYYIFYTFFASYFRENGGSFASHDKQWIPVPFDVESFRTVLDLIPLMKKGMDEHLLTLIFATNAYTFKDLLLPCIRNWAFFKPVGLLSAGIENIHLRVRVQQARGTVVYLSKPQVKTSISMNPRTAIPGHGRG